MFGGAMIRLLYENDVRTQLERSLQEGHETGNVRKAMYDSLGNVKRDDIREELEIIVENAPTDMEIEKRARQRIAQGKFFGRFVYGTMTVALLTMMVPVAKYHIDEIVQERKYEAIYQEALEQGHVYAFEGGSAFQQGGRVYAYENSSSVLIDKDGDGTADYTVITIDGKRVIFDIPEWAIEKYSEMLKIMKPISK